MASDLEAQILITAGSHLPENHLSACWRYLLDEANRTISSAKKQRRNPKPIKLEIGFPTGFPVFFLQTKKLF